MTQVKICLKLEALEWSYGHVGGDGRPQGEGGDGHGDGVWHGEFKITISKFC